MSGNKITKQTPFYQDHIDSGAKMVEFVGWYLPINYGSQVKEHEDVRNKAGMFDVSHMLITDIHGSDAKNFLRYLLSNDVQKLEKVGPGKALYSAMLNQDAGVIDDLIVYLMPFGYRMVTNAATENNVVPWLTKIAANFQVKLIERRDLAMLAVQGPEAIDKVTQIRPYLKDKFAELKPFMSVEDNGFLFARTGYTGENGFEIMLPQNKAHNLWQELLNVDVTPCGLGARDTLRLEAGMNLYGNEMDETVTPSLCGMDWVVDLKDPERNFIGKVSYLNVKDTATEKQVGLILDGKGVLRAHQKVMVGNQEYGIVTSGTFSPTLKKSIAMARVKNNIPEQASVDIRGSLEPVTVVQLPFINKK